MKISDGNSMALDSIKLSDTEKRIWILGDEDEDEIPSKILQNINRENLRWTVYYSAPEFCVDEFMTTFSNCEIECHDSKRIKRKIFKKNHYPVCLIENAGNEILSKILENWTNAVYIEELVCIYDENFVRQTVRDNIYNFDELTQNLLGKKAMIIRNVFCDTDSIYSYDVLYDKNEFPEFDKWIREQ